jgi:hypothetical protein
MDGRPAPRDEGRDRVLDPFSLYVIHRSRRRAREVSCRCDPSRFASANLSWPANAARFKLRSRSYMIAPRMRRAY